LAAFLYLNPLEHLHILLNISLRYLCNSRPGIAYAYAVGIICRFMSEPRVSNLLEAKRVMRYIKGTLEFCILFPKCVDENSIELVAYPDAN